jgi:hypothetical protein
MIRMEELKNVISFLENMDDFEIQKVMHTIIHNYNLCVVVDENSVGGLTTSEIINGFLGMDWDSGKYLLYTKDKLIRR